MLEGGIVLSGIWDEEMPVVLHQMSAYIDLEDIYEAKTIIEDSSNVRIVTRDDDSKKATLEQLIGGLVLLGFGGNMVVDDVTKQGRNGRYRVEITGGLK